MKKYIMMVLAAVMLFALTACGGQKKEDAGKDTSGSQENTGQYTAEIYADFSCGSVTPEEDNLIKTKEVQFSEQPEAKDYAEQLSEWTGLDFTLDDIKQEGAVFYLDWAADSTLIAGLDDRKQKDEFHFDDQDSLRWFMMDSLRLTLTESGGASDVYYTMNDGEELIFDDLSPVNAFTTDTPYMGSAFYFSHADGKGDDDDTESTAETGDEEDETPDHGVLMSSYRFTGLTSIENNEDFYGGYYYSDMTEDGLSIIVNCCFKNEYDSPEECARKIAGQEPRDMDARDTTYDSYIGHYVTWLTGENEDTRQWDGLLIYTDLYTYFYGFDTTAENAEEMSDTWYEVLDQVELTF